MRIMGVDPGTATTGFGVINYEKQSMRFVDAGVISTPAGSPMPDRLATIYAELTQLVKEHKPDLIAVEQLFFARNVTTGIQVGQARGIILLVVSQTNTPMVEFTPLQVKSAVAGYGKALKPQVQEMVKTLLKLDSIPKPDDAADALAIAIAAAHASKL
jgi:crossover junction endodeoxyribonuclease RuvC